MTYEYNEKLFCHLAKILGVKRKDIGERIGHSRMWYTHAVNAGDVMIRHLIAICNTFHISIRSFIITKDDPITPTPLVLDEWIDIEYHPDLLKCLWQNRKDVTVQRKQVQDDTGWDKMTLAAFMEPDNSPMKMRDWVRMVNLYDLDPMMIFGDQNQWVNNKTIQQKDREIESLRLQLLKARLETSTLRSRLAHRDKMDEMKEGL